MTLLEPLFSMFAFKGRALGLHQMWLGITCRCACMQVWVCVSVHECAGVSVCGENRTVLWPWRVNRRWYKDSRYACVCCSLFLRVQTTFWHLRGDKEIAQIELFRWPCSHVSSGICLLSGSISCFKGSSMMLCVVVVLFSLEPLYANFFLLYM